MEKQVHKMTQSMGIGAQFGGKYFCHDVRVVRLPRHGASCPVGIGVSCSADRQVCFFIVLRCFLPPAYLQNVKKVTNVFLVCVFCTSAYVLNDQNTVIIYVNLMPNYFSQYCMLGCF